MSDGLGIAAVIELDLVDMANGGDAVGKLDGRAVFVKGGLAGERVRARIVDLRRDYLRATVTEILSPSPDRVAVPYPDLSETGGLQWQHIAYPAQLEWKTRIVRQLLQRVGHIAQPPVERMLGSPVNGDPWRQRSVAQFAIGDDGAIGFRRTGSHAVLDMPACPIVHPGLDATYQTMRRWLQTRWGSEAGHYIDRFTLRIATQPPLRVTTSSGELPVVGAPAQPGSRRRLPALLSIEAHPGGGILSDGGPEVIGRELMRVMPALVGVVFVGLAGRRGRAIIGQDHLLEQVIDRTFRISAGSFFQVNATQTPVLVQQALDFARVQPHEHVLDGYSGVGLFSLFFAARAAQVTAIESQPSAIADARTSAAFNHAGNITIIEGLLERVVSQLAFDHHHYDVVLVDPPRAGCHPRALQEIKNLNPRAVVYISCDPATLARDLQTFTSDGYHVVRVQPVDMFPNTAHIETVTLIARN